jgi:phospholipid-binding lipoprotein MlaA
MTSTSPRHYPIFALLLTFGVAAGGIATAGEEDPNETLNRAVFSANQFIDSLLLRPIAEGYRDNVPEPARVSIGSFVSNLGQPNVLVNDILQGNPERAWTTTQRFAVNSTIGVGGLFDPATDLDLPGHRASFGQTFGVWGVEPGPPLHLPLLGQTNLRDTVGQVVGSVASPLGYMPGNTMSIISQTGKGFGMVHGRAAEIEASDALAQSSDPYATLRAAQARRVAASVEEAKRGAVQSASR